MSHPPTLPGDFVQGIKRQLREDPLGTLEAASKLGEVVLLRSGFERMYLLNNPRYIKHVLQDNYKNYTRQTGAYPRLLAVLGHGLLNREGDAWLTRRRRLQPVFHRKIAATFADNFVVRASRELAERLQRSCDAGSAVSILPELMDTLLAVMARMLLGRDLGPLVKDAHDWTLLLEARLNASFAPPLWIPTALNRNLRQATVKLELFIQETLRTVCERPGEPSNLFSVLLRAREEAPAPDLDERALRDEVLTMLFAGHETTAVALCWTLFLLSSDPGVDARLRLELDSVLGGRPPTSADLDRLEFTRQVLNEAMRLYPPAWALTRRALSDDEIGGFHIPRGAQVIVSPWITQRSSQWWERPLAFEPERFTAERTAAFPRYTYFPFLGGPRQCIGMQLAIMNAQLILVTLLQRFRFKPFPLIPVVPWPSPILRPRLGLYLLLERAVSVNVVVASNRPK